MKSVHLLLTESWCHSITANLTVDRSRPAAGDLADVLYGKQCHETGTARDGPFSGIVQTHVKMSRLCVCVCETSTQTAEDRSSAPENLLAFDAWWGLISDPGYSLWMKQNNDAKNLHGGLLVIELLEESFHP